MIVIPAIDICSGKVVRLKQGDFSKKTFYSDKPADAAKRWRDEGAELLHIVDLDGAREGEPKNLDAVEEIAKSVKGISIELGGGLRTIESVRQALSRGVTRAIVGTRAYTDENFIKELIAAFGEKIAVSIDALGKNVASQGWTAKTKIKAYDIALKMQSLGVKTIVFTSISKDGMLEGPDMRAIKEMLAKVNIDVIASGGVSSIEDIENLMALGKNNLYGAIVGKALYENRIDLKRAVAVSKAQMSTDKDGHR